jgi:hypothetical protein
MNDPLLVRRFERLRDLLGDGESFGQPVDRRDVRMVERREYFRLALKAREAIRIAGHYYLTHAADTDLAVPS